MEHAELGLNDTLVTRSVCVGALASEAGDRRIDEPRVVGLQLGVAETTIVEHARLVGFDEDVARSGEVANHAQVALITGVEHDAALAAAPERIRGVVADDGAAGRLDLDDIGTEIGEQLTDLSTDAIR